jgi:hypothetical protein
MRDDQAIEVESTELLRTLIKNACVNDRWSNRSPICEWLRAAPDARAGKVATVEREMAHAG